MTARRSRTGWKLFAEPIYETLRPHAWPAVVAFDEAPFKMASTDESGEPGPAVSAFHVFGAYGWQRVYDPGSVVALRATPRFELNQGYPHWMEFLHALDAQLEGRPRQIVCDRDRELLRVVHTVWPRGQKDSPVIIVCHWHLAERLRIRLREDRVDYPDELRDLLKHFRDPECRCAFCTLAGWNRFETAARARAKDIPRTITWIDKNAQLVRWQLAHKAGYRTRVSTGGLENVLKRVGLPFQMRRGVFTNRHRLDLRLKLMELELNHQANASHYAKVIRDELLENGGNGHTRNLYDDHGPYPSLRPPLPEARDKLRQKARMAKAQALVQAQTFAQPEDDDDEEAIPF